ncbi:MAG: carboxymuconolactone decarboxylase family protein [Burkholderiales bacterium]|nr:carboxymuconolactone decarboxylase family protein [Burkholderiales bacterium]
MGDFTQHTDITAPKGSAEVLAKVKARYGFIPNLGATIAESPVALDALLNLIAAFESTSLTPQEQQLVLLTASVSNDCNYCRTVHVGLGRQAGIDAATINATLDAGPLESRKLNALRDLTAALVEQRGRVDEEKIHAFLSAGYTKAQVFEVVMGVAQKTFTNYCNHLAGVEPNVEFVAMAKAK